MGKIEYHVNDRLPIVEWKFKLANMGAAGVNDAQQAAAAGGDDSTSMKHAASVSDLTFVVDSKTEHSTRTGVLAPARHLMMLMKLLQLHWNNSNQRMLFHFKAKGETPELLNVLNIVITSIDGYLMKMNT